MQRVVVVGGGWGGCVAAVSAAKRGAEVILLEKNDRLLGYGLVAGEVYQNGRLTISLEAQALGGQEVFAAMESVVRHRNVPVPGVAHTVIYDVLQIEDAVRQVLNGLDVQVRTETRVKGVSAEKGTLQAVVLDGGEEVSGTVFVDCTGTAGPLKWCQRHGGGCAMCINRCHTFGSRVSVVAEAGIAEATLVRPDGRLGGFGQGVNILKETLDVGLVRELETKGIALVPVPPGFSTQSLDTPKGDAKALAENLVVVDNGFAKVKSRPFIPLSKLREIPAFRRAVYFDPQGGSKTNCVRFMAVAPRHETLQVIGAANLFCAGEKQGLLVGCCEAIVTGLLAGSNAARMAAGEDLVTLPRSTACGEMLAFTSEVLVAKEAFGTRYSCVSGALFKSLVDKGLYVSDPALVQQRVQAQGLTNIL